VLLVEREGSVFGIPLASVAEIVAVSDTMSLRGRPAVAVHGEPLPLVDLVAALGGSPRRPVEPGPALIVRTPDGSVALACDRLVGEQEILVKTLGPLLAGVPGYLGAAVLGDGRVALIADPAQLVSRPAESGLRAPAPAEERGAPKVLVVDDQFTVRELQRSILEAAGYRVETARDGREARELLTDDGDIDLVVTDIEMPEVDGFELLQSIRRDAERASLPVVIVTSRGSEEDHRRGLEAGADAYIAKDRFDQKALIETVSRLVGA
jgi:two-component system chemotaxis sensor kinase CheA